MATPIDKLAWIHLRDGKVLSTRSIGREVFYLPGGKREPGESDADALTREIREELTIQLIRDRLELFGIYEAQAHGHAEGVLVRMTCYTGPYTGSIAASSEIEVVAWLDSSDAEVVSPVDRIIFEELRHQGLIR